VLLGHLGQQAEGGQPDEEPVRHRPRAKAERGPHRVGLWSRESFQAVQHRRQQLVQPGVGQLHLRLDPCRMRRPAARRLLDQVVEQGRLAHPGLPAHHQDPALTGADRVEEPVQQVTFTAPTPQLPGAPPLMDGAASARHRHYAAPTTPWRNPQFSASCSAISIKASMSGLRESGRMARQPPNTTSAMRLL
jgi:hypothetical protein